MFIKAICKKIFSITLSLIMVLSLFSCIPFNSSAFGDVYKKDFVSHTYNSSTKNSDVFASGLGASVVPGRVSAQAQERTKSDSGWSNWSVVAGSEKKIEPKTHTTEALQENSNLSSSVLLENLYDNSIGNEYYFGGGYFVEKNSTEFNENTFLSENNTTKQRCYDVIYNLKANIKIKNIVLAGSSNSLLRMGHFSIYISNDITTLFNDTNKIFEFDNKDKADVVPRSHIISFNNSKEPEAQYVALRVYNPYFTTNVAKLTEDSKAAPNTPANCYIRLQEFNVYSTDEYSVKRTHLNFNESDDYNNKLVESYNSTSNKADTLERTLIKDYSTDAFIKYNGTRYETKFCVKENGQEVTDRYEGLTSLTDLSGKLGTDIMPADNQSSSAGYFAEATNGSTFTPIDDEEHLYYQFDYQLASETNIIGFKLLNSCTCALVTSHYKISVANKKDDLFTKNAVYTTGDIYNDCSINEITLRSAKKGTFVGFRIINGANVEAGVNYSSVGYTYKTLYTRLAELMVFGTYVNSAESPVQKAKVELSPGVYKNITNNSANAEFTFSGNPDENGDYPKTADVTATAKPSVRVDGKWYSFLRWVDINEVPVANQDGLSCTFNLQELNQITAIYGVSDKQVTYTFVDKSGNTLHEAKIAYGTYISREDYEKANAKVPELVGYTKAKELTTVGSLTANLQIWSADIYNTPAIEDATFTPSYTPSSNKYNVTVDGNSKSYAFDTKITLASGSGWKVNDVDWQSSSGSETYTYTVGDMNITKSQTISNVISLYNPEGKNSPTLQNGNITVFAKLNLPSNATLNECGVLYMGNGYLADTDYTSGLYNKLTIGSADQTITANKPNGKHFSATLYSVGRKRTRIARAYVKYTINGTPYTKYSNVITVSTK